MQGRSLDPKPFKIAILWRGDAEAREAATPQNNRFYRIFEELAAVGIHAEPAVYDEGFPEEVREQLLAGDGVLVWVDPIHQGKARAALDPLLRDVASRGPWVGAHPDVILKMGVKEVLYRTKHLGWGCGTHLYRTTAEFAAAFPRRLQSGPGLSSRTEATAARGVWKVERIPPRAGTVDTVRVPACTPGERTAGPAASGIHGALRALFRLGRMHHRSAVSAAPARRDDTVLHREG
jgi:hypothetical protein